MAALTDVKSKVGRQHKSGKEGYLYSSPVSVGRAVAHEGRACVERETAAADAATLQFRKKKLY